MMATIRRALRFVFDPTFQLRAESVTAARRAGETADRVQVCLDHHERIADPIAAFAHHIRGRQVKKP